MPYTKIKDKRANAALYRERNREKIRARNNSPKYKRQRKRWLKENRIWQRQRENDYRRNKRQRLLKSSCDICDICESRAHLVLDHSHDFAKKHCGHAPERHCKKCRRGTLCGNCNTGLGKFKENLLLLGNGKAGRYLKKWNRRTQ
jgi:hypothetical protein